MATLESRLGSFITALGVDIKALQKGLPFYVQFGRPGNLATFTGPRMYFPDDVELLGAAFSVTTAPTGSSAVFEVLKDGSGTFSSDPTISASGFLASAGTLAGTTLYTARTNYLQINCSAIGSTIPGADLVVNLKMKLS